MSNFIENAIQFIKGETPKQVAERVQKRATTAFKGQLAAIENDILSAKDALETAEEEYKNALYNNGVKEFNSDKYLSKVFEHQGIVESKKEYLSRLEERKTVIEKILEDLK